MKYIYHYCALRQKITFDGVKQIFMDGVVEASSAIDSIERYEQVKKDIASKFTFQTNEFTISSMAFLGVKYEAKT